MQQLMNSYVCGINLRSESSLVCRIYFLRKIGVPENSTEACLSHEK